MKENIGKFDVDILAFGAHPDDVEVSAGGTLAVAHQQGKSIGIIDLTQGELGTRGNKDIRHKEAMLAKKILGAAVRENLFIPDGNVENNYENRKKVIRVIRAYRPKVVLCNAIYDRHPDHGIGASLVRDAFFLAGLSKYETTLAGEKQEAWRPFRLLHYIQDMDMKPDFFVDISAVWSIKQQAIFAYESQFHTPRQAHDNEFKNEKSTYISSADFMEAFHARCRYYGKRIGVKYAEPFLSVKPLGVRSLDAFIDAIF